MDWHEVAEQLEALYAASTRLEVLFPGRKFTLDGHLVGSIGEVIAAYIFDLNLARGSTQGHDAYTRDGRQVEVKFTQGTSVALREEPAHLIVLHRHKAGSVRVAYNGPGGPVWASCGALQKNGQRPITLAKLGKIDALVADADRLPRVREAPL